MSPPFPLGSGGGGGGRGLGTHGGHHKRSHNNRKRSAAAKRRRRRERARADSLASSQTSQASSSSTAAASVGSPAAASAAAAAGPQHAQAGGSASAAPETPVHAAKVNGVGSGGSSVVSGCRPGQRLSFSSESTPADGRKRQQQRHRDNKQSSPPSSPLFDSTPQSLSSTHVTGGADGSTSGSQSRHHGHIRSIEFVYPRSAQSAEQSPRTFAFPGGSASGSGKRKKKDKSNNKKHHDYANGADGEEKKMDPTDDAVKSARPRSLTEESIDDILYPERKRKRERLQADAATADNVSATATARDKYKREQSASSSSKKEKKKRKRKRLSSGDAGEIEVTSATRSDVEPRKEDEREVAAESEKHKSKGHEKKRSDSIASVDSSADTAAGRKRKRSSSVGSEASVGKDAESKGRKKRGKRKYSEDHAHEQEEEEDGFRRTRTGLLERRLSGISVDEAVADMDGRRPRSNSTDGELNLPRRGLCDERAVLESHKWNARRMYGDLNGASIKGILRHDPRGFNNMGNTCYLNATMQCLAYLPTFCQCVAELPKLERHSNTGGKGKITTDLVRTLLRKAHNLEVGRTQEGIETQPYSPSGIVKNIKNLSSSSRGYQFRPGRQEDAHEFLIHLLDAMNDGELKAAGINQRESGWRDQLPISRLDETTFISRIFGGYLRSQIRCTNCNYKSNTYDPFLDLALEVNTKDSVQKAFKDFTREETLDADNQWKCSGCKRRVCAKKQLTVFRPPLSLVVQLKRFTFGSGGGMFGGLMPFGKGSGWGYGHYAGKGMGMKGRGGSKITKPIAFPSVLKLPLSDKRMCIYELTGVVIHIGGSATSGHYTAYVKKPQSGDAKPKWYHLDDSFVEQVSEASVLRQKHAYLLFYCRKEVDMALPSPPPRKSSMTASEAKTAGAKRARARADSLSSLGSSREVTASESFSLSKMSSTKMPLKSSTSKSTSTSKTTKEKPSSSVQSPCSSSSSSSESSSTEDESDGSGVDDISGARRKLDASLARAEREAKGLEPQSIGSEGESLTFHSGEGHSNRSSSSDDDSSDDDSSSSSSTEKKMPAKKASASTTSAKARKPETVSASTGGGKMEVKIGNRQKVKKPWRPSAVSPKERRNDGSSDLLGNMTVSRWDDDDEEEESYDMAVHGRSTADTLSAQRRKEAMKEMQARDRKQKRKMHLDRWDAGLDEGRTKKVKNKNAEFNVDSSPELNRFQRIQHDMMAMNRGKAKGYHGTPVPKMPRKNRKHSGNRRRTF